MFPAGCSSEPGVKDGEANANAACEAEGIEGCGDSCARSSDCDAGLYCHAGTKECSAACIAGTKEDPYCEGEDCKDDGQCVGSKDNSTEAGGTTTIGIGNGGAGSGSGNGSGGDGGKDCIDAKVAFEPEIPNVVLLIDQSGSMNASNFGSAVKSAESAGEYVKWDCGDGPDGGSEDDEYWRWNVVRNVLLNPDHGVVKPLEDRVRFGLSLYTSDGGFGSDPDNPKECPGLTTVDTKLDNHADMLAEFKCSDIKGDTPTRESLTATAEGLAAMDLEGPKVIILATDGEPDNCTCPNWNDAAGPTCDDDAENFVERGGESMSPEKAEQYDVVQEAKRIYDELGIIVSVIDVSRPDATSLRAHLTDVADAGGGDIYDGTNPGGLVDAFQTIIDGVRSCAIDLDGEIAKGKESTGTVLLDGTKLKLDDPDGWKVNTPTQIELVGDACETIKSGDHDLDVSFPCGSFVPSIK